jgi:hypothetical protein
MSHRTEVAVSLVPPAVEPAQVAERDHARAGTRVQWLILFCYLLAAVALTYQLWADPAARAQRLSGGSISRDTYLNAWFMRYAATAIAHGKLPALVTKAVNAPEGINLMWNTSFLLPGVLMAPVTLLAGPQVSLTIVLTLGLAGSAASMFLVLRRWGASISAAALGGAVYGFSPALRIAVEGHYFLEFAVLPPLIIDALLLLLTGRGRAVRTGAWLGLLISAQLFIAEEVTAEIAVAGLIILAVLAASRPSAVLARARPTLAGLATAAGVTVLLCGHALWVQFHGPLTEHGSPWDIARYGNLPRDFVTAPSGLLLHTEDFIQFLASTNQRLEEYFPYLGWPLLVVLLAAAVFFWRDTRVRVAAVTFAVLELFSIGGHTVTVAGLRIPAAALPWHWLLNVPLLGQMLPNRFSILADGAAAAVLAFSLDRARAAAPTAPAPAPAPRWRRYAAVAVTALALLPIIPSPVQASALHPPAPGWQAALARLHLAPDAPVLVIPMNSGLSLDWQAATGGQPESVIGGYCIAPFPSGKAGPCGNIGDQAVIQILNALFLGKPHAYAPSRQQMRQALAAWKPAAIVTKASTGSRLGSVLIRFFGPPAVQISKVLAWRL